MDTNTRTNAPPNSPTNAPTNASTTIDADAAMGAFEQEIRNRGAIVHPMPAAAALSPPVSYADFKPTQLIEAANRRTNNGPVHHEMQLYIACFCRNPDLLILTEQYKADHPTCPNAWTIPHLTLRMPYAGTHEPTIRQIVMNKLDSEHVVGNRPQRPYQLFEEVSPVQIILPQAGQPATTLHVGVLVRITDPAHFEPKGNVGPAGQSQFVYGNKAWASYEQVQMLKLGQNSLRFGDALTWILLQAFGRAKAARGP